MGLCQGNIRTSSFHVSVYPEMVPVKLGCASDHLEGLLNRVLPLTLHPVSDSVGLRWGLRMYTSNKFQAMLMLGEALRFENLCPKSMTKETQRA